MIVMRFATSDLTRGDARIQYLDAHKQWLRSLPIKMLLSGPLTDDVANSAALIVAEAESLHQFKTLCSNDPFVEHAVYLKTEILEWRPSFGMLLEHITQREEE